MVFDKLQAQKDNLLEPRFLSDDFANEETKKCFGVLVNIPILTTALPFLSIRRVSLQLLNGFVSKLHS